MSKKKLDNTRQAIYDLRFCANLLTTTQNTTGVSLKNEIKKLNLEAAKLEKALDKETGTDKEKGKK